MIEILTAGKELKKFFANVKGVQKVVVPMGSNYELMQPDLGVIMEEKGQQKKGNLNFSQLGKLSKHEYTEKYNKMSFNSKGNTSK
jgi:hypothetical protein